MGKTRRPRAHANGTVQEHGNSLWFQLACARRNTYHWFPIGRVTTRVSCTPASTDSTLSPSLPNFCTCLGESTATLCGVLALLPLLSDRQARPDLFPLLLCLLRLRLRRRRARGLRLLVLLLSLTPTAPNSFDPQQKSSPASVTAAV